MYDTPGIFYYLMRNAPEINNVSGSVVLLKHPETPCGIFRKRLYANQEDASPKAHSIQKSNFSIFLHGYEAAGLQIGNKYFKSRLMIFKNKCII